MRQANLFWQGALNRGWLALVFAGGCLMGAAPAFAQDTVPAIMNGIADFSINDRADCVAVFGIGYDLVHPHHYCVVSFTPSYGNPANTP